LRRVNDAPLLRTQEKGSLCHRYPAFASFPPTGPALLGTRLCGASPGIRVSRSGFQAGKFQTSLASENKKPSGAFGSGGSVRCGLSNSLMRDRSHEPGVRHRPANNRSIVRRAFRICGSSQGSCWFANPIVREGAGNTPATCGCQATDRRNVATAGEIVERARLTVSGISRQMPCRGRR
jgi:hypothetical protein